MSKCDLTNYLRLIMRLSMIKLFAFILLKHWNTMYGFGISPNPSPVEGYIIAVAILSLRRKIVIIDATACVFLEVPSACSPVGDLDPDGINTGSILTYKIMFYNIYVFGILLFSSSI